MGLTSIPGGGGGGGGRALRRGVSATADAAGAADDPMPSPSIIHNTLSGTAITCEMSTWLFDHVACVTVRNTEFSIIRQDGMNDIVQSALTTNSAASEESSTLPSGSCDSG